MIFDQMNFTLNKEDARRKEDVMRKLRERYKDYKDPWGFDLKRIEMMIDLIYPIYKKYFKVRVFGIENVKDSSYMMVSNHTGQLPIDAALITMAMAMETDHPQVIHSMIERFMAALPFIGEWAAEAGAILGDRENCKWLLDKGESILVFPEGVKGINKKTKDFYKLQRFSTGFFRIALQTKTSILPIAVVGAEEMFPIVFQAPYLAKKLGLPNLPLPLNFIPLPSPIDIYIGEAVELPESLNPESPDSEIRKALHPIEKSIHEQILKGLKERRSFFEWARKPINDVMKKF